MAFEYVLMTHRKIYQLKIKIKLKYSMYRKSKICIGSKKKNATNCSLEISLTKRKNDVFL